MTVKASMVNATHHRDCCGNPNSNTNNEKINRRRDKYLYLELRRQTPLQRGKVHWNFIGPFIDSVITTLAYQQHPTKSPTLILVFPNVTGAHSSKQSVVISIWSNLTNSKIKLLLFSREITRTFSAGCQMKGNVPSRRLSVIPSPKRRRNVQQLY